MAQHLIGVERIGGGNFNPLKIARGQLQIALNRRHHDQGHALLAEDRPVQLLCVKNLRYSLERRLGASAEDAGPSKRVNYHEVVRRVHWRRVDSAFEADAVYLEAARAIFPQTYRGMLGLRPAWFVHVNSHTTYPRYTKTNDPTGKTGMYFGRTFGAS